MSMGQQRAFRDCVLRRHQSYSFRCLSVQAARTWALQLSERTPHLERTPLGDGSGDGSSDGGSRSSMSTPSQAGRRLADVTGVPATANAKAVTYATEFTAPSSETAPAAHRRRRHRRRPVGWRYGEYEAMRRFLRQSAPNFRVHLDSTCEPRWREIWRADPEAYGLQGLLPRMVELSEFFTADWREANASLVVLLVPERSGTPAIAQQQCLQRQRLRSAAYRATGGARHYFLFTGPHGPCCANGPYKDVRFVRHHIIHQGTIESVHTHELPSPPVPCFEGRKDLNLPRLPRAAYLPRPESARLVSDGATDPSFAAGAAWADTPPPDDRPHVLYFSGPRCWRVDVRSLFRSDSRVLIGNDRANPGSAAARGTTLARFCALCSSDSEITLAGLLGMGCVPVLVGRRLGSLRPPWHDLLNYSDFTVASSVGGLPHLLPALQSLDARRMQRVGRRILWAYAYHLQASALPSAEDSMLPLFVYQIARMGQRGEAPAPTPIKLVRQLSNNVRTWGDTRYGAVSRIDVNGTQWRCYTYGKACSCWDHDRRLREQKQKWAQRQATRTAGNVSAAAPASTTTADSKLCVICRRVSDAGGCSGQRVSTSDGTRWLLAFAHPSNGLGNRLAGLRTSLAIAQATGRRLAIRWVGHGQESSWLRPSSASLQGQWNVSRGLLSFARGDGVEFDLRGKPSWTPWPPGSKQCPKLPETAPLLSSVRCASHGSVVGDSPPSPRCGAAVPLLGQLSPRVPEDVAAYDRFVQIASGATVLVVVESQTHDFASRGQSQAQVASIASAQYRQLLAPSRAFQRAACAHLERLGLREGTTWVGLQLRRSPVPERDLALLKPPGSGPSLADLHGYDDQLSRADAASVRAAVDCARRMQAALCASVATPRCSIPIFISSSSVRALRLAASLVGEDARWVREETFTFHTGPKAGYLPALLEMAVLSAATAIVGTSGSSYAIEAANMGNVSAVLRHFNHLYGTVELPAFAEQGECDRPPPVRGQSLLLPAGVCHALR